MGSRKRQILFGLGCGLLSIGVLQMSSFVTALAQVLSSPQASLDPGTLAITGLLGIGLCLCGAFGIWKYAPLACRIASSLLAFALVAVSMVWYGVTSFGLFEGMVCLLYLLLSVLLHRENRANPPS